MRQVVANKLQTITSNENTQKERITTHKLKQETYEKILTINIKRR
jgi:hypothetical protein